MGEFTRYDLSGGGSAAEADRRDETLRMAAADRRDETLRTAAADRRDETLRTAAAGGRILMSEECFSMVRNGSIKGGDVLAMARAAGILGAKRASELIPTCPLLRLESVEIGFSLDPEICGVEVKCTVKTKENSRLDMEAICGVNAALLSIFDMCKSVDRGMAVENVHLLHPSDRAGEIRQAAPSQDGYTQTAPRQSGLKLWGEPQETKQKERADGLDGLSLWDM